VKKFNKKSKK